MRPPSLVSTANKLKLLLVSTEDDVQKVVSLCVDGKEAQLVFIDHAFTDMSVSGHHDKFASKATNQEQVQLMKIPTTHFSSR